MRYILRDRSGIAHLLGIININFEDVKTKILIHAVQKIIVVGIYKKITQYTRKQL